MSTSRYLQTILSLIAVLLVVLVVRPLLTPKTVYGSAAPQLNDAIFIEPGTTMLRSPDGSRQVIGKVVIDRSGNIWGFPTTTDAPYPVDTTKSIPATSRPFLLGRFDFDAMRSQ